MKELTGNKLKIIAIITMFIDHFGATVLERYIKCNNGGARIVNVITVLYYILRLIGRMAFPIFVFLLVEGMIHTRNKYKYLLRLFLFSLISEIPFDLAFSLRDSDIKSHRLIEFGYQNVFFTLFLGGVLILILSFIEEKRKKDKVSFFMKGAAIVAFMAIAEIMRTDYAMVGVLVIAVMWLYRNDTDKGILYSCLILFLASPNEIAAFASKLPISKYNGKKGRSIKYFFYVFYPAHLIILWLICVALKLPILI